ncbi:MAG TPA: sensor histidine kinase [Ruminococcaceae bacterium]|nr:sensor histidine kinase [Oscillospiraceae bacterium]
MQKSLFYRYFSICSAIILISLTVLGVVLMVCATQYFRQDKYKLLYRNAVQAVELTMANYKENNYLYIEKSEILPVYTILAGSIDADMFLVDLTGKTLICTHRAPCNHTTYLIDQSIIEQAKKGQYRETGKLSGIYPTAYYTVGLPIHNSDGTAAGVVFVSTSAEALTLFLIEILRMFAISSMVVIICGFIIIYFVTNRLVTPLRQMVYATQSFSNGDFSIRVPINDYDEIGKLAAAFNNMASSLAQLETVRRSFVANVSHELKTPMTTIAGFIDGILDGTIPQEKHSYYLKIVSDEVKRLSRLVVSMLNIAKIEAGEMSIKPAVFDIASTVCSTIFTFERAIEEKNLEVRGLDSGKFYVEADPDMLHQVVYNLVENAVKFSQQGGYIEVSYNVDGAVTSVAVKNSGQGINKDDLPKIFDRFYKTDKSRSLDKTGVGLGLHIVRSIINLHGGEIIVRSVEGEYCEFVFTLPTAKNIPARKGEKHAKQPPVPANENTAEK